MDQPKAQIVDRQPAAIEAQRAIERPERRRTRPEQPRGMKPQRAIGIARLVEIDRGIGKQSLARARAFGRRDDMAACIREIVEVELLCADSAVDQVPAVALSDGGVAGDIRSADHAAERADPPVAAIAPHPRREPHRLGPRQPGLDDRIDIAEVGRARRHPRVEMGDVECAVCGCRNTQIDRRAADRRRERPAAVATDGRTANIDPHGRVEEPPRPRDAHAGAIDLQRDIRAAIALRILIDDAAMGDREHAEMG